MRRGHQSITNQYRKELLGLLKPSEESGKISKYRRVQIMRASSYRWSNSPDWYFDYDRYERAKDTLRRELMPFDPDRARGISVQLNGP